MMKSRCSGSFQCVSTDMAGRKTTDGKIQVPCPWCQRLVGLRRQVRGSRGVLAQHECPERTVNHDDYDGNGREQE